MNTINKKQLRKAFQSGLINEETFKQELLKLELELQLPKQRKKQLLPKSITPEEFKKLISIIPKRKDGSFRDKNMMVAILLSYGAGLRISEIVGQAKENRNIIPPLTRDNFQMEINPPQIKIYGKESKERVVPVPKGWREWMFSILPIKRTSRALQYKFKRYIRLADLNQDYTFHSLRHGFATRLVDNGVPIAHVQYLLGHSNLVTTSIYVKARPIDALKSYEEMF